MQSASLSIHDRLTAALAGLFPAGLGVECVVATGWRAEPELLEAEWDPEMAPRRRQEFALGRACARLALRRLGGPTGPIPRAVGGWPQWPAGFIGSISHSGGIVAAAVGRAGAAGLGIDIERAEAPDPRRSRIFMSAPERRAMTEWPDAPAGGWPPVVFSAKEAVFKAQPPAATQGLGLRDFVLIPTSNGSGFVAADSDGARTEVRYALHGGLVLAGAVRTDG